LPHVLVLLLLGQCLLTIQHGESHEVCHATFKPGILFPPHPNVLNGLLTWANPGSPILRASGMRSSMILSSRAEQRREPLRGTHVKTGMERQRRTACRPAIVEP
jgi:hypothetical protein